MELSNFRVVGMASLLCLLAAAVPLQARAATEQHLLDAQLSLTGSCQTDSADAVPDPWCPGPPGPSAKFENSSVAVDSFGDVYMSSLKEEGSAGRVDVFSPEGEFITELTIEGPQTLAVDPKGNLYVNSLTPTAEPGKVILFRPTTYDPEAGEIAYSDPGEVIIENIELAAPCGEHYAPERVGLAIDPATEHLFVSPSGCIGEWSSASDPGGPELLNSSIGVGVLGNSSALSLDSAHNRLYVTQPNGSNSGSVIRVFELAAPHAYLGLLDGHETPAGKFLSLGGRETTDVDEATGNLIVSELISTSQVFEFGPGLGANEELLNTYEYSGFGKGGPYEPAVDNSPASPNYRTYFISSRGSALHHVFAFRFSEIEAPVVESAEVSGLTESEVVLEGVVNPSGGETDYRIEYVTETAFDASGFDEAVLASSGSLPAGIGGVPVSASVTGLVPGTSYRFRITAENEVGVDQGEGSFRTYRSPSVGGPCDNAARRTGPSAGLPDCRAYELVSPADTNGLSPLGAGPVGVYFPTLQASLDGSRASFRIEGGALPGFDAAASTNGDDYLAARGSAGWTTELVSPNGREAVTPAPGGFSPDLRFSFWKGDAPLATTNGRNPHIRYPDGHSERVGRGSLATDPEVEARLIAEGGSHTIFSSFNAKAIRLEPNSPPAGTAAIYDRTADEVTHVVSLLPGDVTPTAGKHATYLGASLDGEGVAFTIAGSNVVYLRQDNATTYEVAAGVTFAGIAEGGGRVFYLQSGNLFAFDAASETAIKFSKGGDTTPVNISPDGTTAYFLSPDVLTLNPGPRGGVAQAGGDNLYVSREGKLDFVATVDALDVAVLKPFGGSGLPVGLGQWVKSVEAGIPGIETSRTTADGQALLFESRAALTDYDPEGNTEIYRYDLSVPSLTCLSCNPTGAAPAGDASLETIPTDPSERQVLGPANRLLNIRADGRRAFFQSYDPLVLADTDGKQDVYEWEAQGVGSCSEPGGCVYLISFGESDRDEHLFAVSEREGGGGDAFFISGSLLVRGDRDATPSLYDARVDGGFQEDESAPPCQGEGCRGGLVLPPALTVPATPALGESGNVNRRCPKGKHRVKRGGKVRCVKKRRHGHRHRGSSKQRQSR